MTAVSFQRKLVRHDLLAGAIITLPSPEIAEIFSLSGLDWLFVDMEHSALTFQDAQRILQTAAPKVPCLIRVPANDAVWIKKALDIGASGIIVPQVKTADDAVRAVRWGKYPPAGDRSVGIARAQGYGATFGEYVASANDETAVVIQIEHIDAVDDIDNILKVPGIDAVFIGPYDLSASMGKTGRTTDTDVQQAISRVKACAERARMPLGIFGATAEAVQPYIREGYTLIAAGIDTMLIHAAAKNITAVLKET
jgi:4-hydroxy-2-oxoheptanedioate aldolase